MRKCERPDHVRVTYVGGKTACHTCRVLKTPKRDKAYYQRKYAMAKAKPNYLASQRARHRKMKYGFIGEVIGPCQICAERPATDVDHCHESGKVRGFLCRRCNVWLAVVENKLFVAQATEYLTKDKS